MNQKIFCSKCKFMVIKKSKEADPEWKLFIQREDEIKQKLIHWDY